MIERASWGVFMQRVLLIGHPNVGKSAVFSHLTDKFAVISNYPGTTVEVMTGICRKGRLEIEIIDTPGIYSLYPLTAEESITRTILASTPIRYVIHVVDGKNTERMLPLTLELIELGFPVILAVNMLDEVERGGIKIDFLGLQAELGIPVVGTNGLSGEGLPRLKHLLFHTAPSNTLPSSPVIPLTPHSKQQQHYRNRTQEITTHHIDYDPNLSPWTCLDTILLHPIVGLIIGILFLYTIIYQVMGQFAAGFLVDLIDTHIFKSLIDPWFAKITDPISNTLFASLLSGDYGLFTLGFRYTFVIILPIVGVFFFTFALLEDSGYLPRFAAVMDRWCQYIGLSGTAMIPLVLGLGCGTMAVLSTRILETRRERKIATFLLALVIPCSSQMALFVSLLSLHPQAFIVWLFTLLTVFLGAGSLSALVLPGSESTFCQEIPPLRLPNLKRSLSKTTHRLTWYIYEVIPLFFTTTLVIWLSSLVGVFPFLISWLETLAFWLRLPQEFASVFLLGFFRRDYGAAGLYDLAPSLNWQQLAVISVVLTLFTPCSAQLITMIRERGLWWTLVITLTIMGISICTGVILARWVL